MQDINSGLMQVPPTNFESFLVWYGDHWVLGTILVILAFQLLMAPFRIILRYIRSRNIKNAGWPPSHLDADGTFREDD